MLFASIRHPSQFFPLSQPYLYTQFVEHEIIILWKREGDNNVTPSPIGVVQLFPTIPDLASDHQTPHL